MNYKFIFIIIIIFISINTYSLSTKNQKIIKEQKIIVDLEKNKTKEYKLNERIQTTKEIIQITKDIIIILGIILGGFIGYIAIMKAVKIDNIKKIIDIDFEKRKKIQDECNKQEIEYVKYLNKNEAISITEIEKLYLDSQKIYEIGSTNKTEIANISYLLTNTIRLLSKYYKNQNNKIPYSEIYYFYIEIITMIKDYSIKNTTFPTLRNIFSYTKKVPTHKILKKYIKQSDNKILNFIEFGTNFKKIGLDIISYYEQVNLSRDYIIYKSAFRIYKNNYPIMILLHLNKIYFPPIITLEPYIGLDNNKIILILIGFEFKKELFTNKRNINLYFMPEKEINGLQELQELKEKSYDYYTNIKDQLLNTEIGDYKIRKISVSQISTLEYNVDYDKCKEAYKKNKKKFLREIKRNNRS